MTAAPYYVQLSATPCSLIQMSCVAHSFILELAGMHINSSYDIFLLRKWSTRDFMGCNKPFSKWNILNTGCRKRTELMFEINARRNFQVKLNQLM